MKILILGLVIGLGLTACDAETWRVIDEILTPTDQEVCESELIGGEWDSAQQKCFRVSVTREEI